MAKTAGTMHNVTASLRSLLRFLHVDGVVAEDLTGAVPAVAPHARPLPRSLDAGAVERALDALRHAAQGTENTMPHILNAVRAYATVGEICDAFREVFGVYTETSVV